jgi:hypothetical protein
MEIPLDELKENLENELSQRNIEKFLFRSLRRETKPASGDDDAPLENIGKEKL